MVDKALLVARGDSPDGGVAGAGIPLGPLASMPVANRPLLEHALDAIFASGVGEVAIVAEPGMRRSVDTIVGSLNGRRGRVSIFEQQPGDGLGAALESAQSVLGGEPFLLHLGDALCWELVDGVGDERLDADDAVVMIKAQGRRSGSDGDQRLTVVDGRGSRSGHLGVYIVGSGFAGYVGRDDDARGLSAQARAAIATMRRNGGQVSHRRKSASWRYAIGSDNLLRANRVALDRLYPGRITAELIDTEVEGSVLIDPSSVVQSSVIRGPVVIGPNVRIVNSYIGPFTSVAGGVEIEGTEIEHSVIFGGVSIRHLGTRLETSVIGPNAKVVRDFRLPRAVRLDVGPGSQVSLA